MIRGIDKFICNCSKGNKLSIAIWMVEGMPNPREYSLLHFYCNATLCSLIRPSKRASMVGRTAEKKSRVRETTRR